MYFTIAIPYPRYYTMNHLPWRAIDWQLYSSTHQSHCSLDHHLTLRTSLFIVA